MEKDIRPQLDKWTAIASLIFQTIEQSDGGMCAYISGQLSSLSDYSMQISTLKIKEEDKKSTWISIEDRLPENQDIVLVKDEYGGKSTAYLHGKKSGFITYGEDAYKVFGEITHWMPIPEFEEI